MNIIYEPKGKAREYSPLAANLYSGCGHKCVYCYVPSVIQRDREDFDNNISGRNNVIEQLKKDAKKIYNSDKQVLMSFSTDPYNPLNEQMNLTTKALKIFLDNKIPVAILTKSGTKALVDLDLFKKFGEHIKIGASLTYDNSEQSLRTEAGAAIPDDRLEMLRVCHENNIKTWVSFEPIIIQSQTINLINKTLDFVDEYQFGKLAEEKRNILWFDYLTKVTAILRTAQKDFYIKKTLRDAVPNFVFNEYEIEMDYLTLPKFKIGQECFGESLFANA